MLPTFDAGLIAQTVKEWSTNRLNTSVKTGSVAYFIKIDEQWGFKFYRSKPWAELMILRQMLAHEHGLGPYCDTTVHSFRWETRGRDYYGFFTHVVKELSAGGWGSDEYFACKAMHSNLCDTLRAKGQDWGSLAHDIHTELNWGLYLDKVVVYDFSSWIWAPEGLGHNEFVRNYPGECPYGDYLQESIA
jgi:hypothetical protein